MEDNKIDNSEFALARLRSLYTNQDLGDITLKVGSRVFSSHRLILTMTSDVFKTMLTGTTWPESKSNRIVLREEPECEEVFEDFLKYFYSGEITLHHTTVLPLLMLADKYNVPDLSKCCLLYMRNHCLPQCAGDVVAWLQYAVFHESTQLEEKCRNFILYNLEMVMKTREFSLMNTDILIMILKSSDIVVKDEFTLYTAMKSLVLKYRNEVSQSEFRDLFFKVMSHIRFPMIQLNQLASLETDFLVQEFKDFYLDNIFRAIKYHSETTPSEKTSIKRFIATKYSSLMFKPRNYTSETWSTVITVEKFSSIAPGDVHSTFFSTPTSCSEIHQHQTWDWHVDLYPKGVIYKRCLMISVPTNLVLNEECFRTVRLSVSTNCEECRRVQICILLIAHQECGQEYVKDAVTRYAFFDEESSLKNIDDIISYDMLNSADSPYLLYPDSMKVVVVIKPVS